MANETIAVLGLGHMGRGMVESLVRAGFHVRAWNRSPGRIPAGDRVEICGTARDAVGGVRVVLTSLANDQAVRDVTFGDAGFLAAMEPGAIHVGASTISLALARELTDRHAEAGRPYVGAAVLGRPEAAERAELWVLTGGDPDALARCEPVFSAIGKGSVRCGTAVQAHLTKLVINFMLGSMIEMLGEGMALAEKGGVSPAKLVEMLGTVGVAPPALVRYGDMVARGRFDPAGFRLELGYKDLSLALAAGDELRSPLPLASLVHDHMLAALAKGHGNLDWSAVALEARESAGLPVEA
jgi:3-hydroxyisobutyrate dehydrogenase-like beta-hydroxyacid dehydrogenase